MSAEWIRLERKLPLCVKCHQTLPIIMTDRALWIKKEKEKNKIKASGTGTLKGTTLGCACWWRHRRSVYSLTPGHDRSLKVTVDWGCLCWIVRQVNVAFPTVETWAEDSIWRKEEEEKSSQVFYMKTFSSSKFLSQIQFQSSPSVTGFDIWYVFSDICSITVPWF